MRLVKKNPILHFIYEAAFLYPAPQNISYLWNFGVFAIVCLVIQLVTGIALAMHYVPNVEMAFASVEHIMRDVNSGWLLRYVHANGASMFFIVVYLHIFRGLYYGSYLHPRQWVWYVGVVIFLLMIITAFLGYVLPWGQMSFWAATVITNFVTAIPFVGMDIVQWIWGGFSVGNPTLNRFFSLHYLLPFIIVALVFIHLVFLHDVKSNNPVGLIVTRDKIPFGPYFYLKDFYSVLLFFIFFALFVFFFPNYLGHSDNYIEANPMVTPTHIVPEWYFLPFYAILRAIPDKLGGVLALVGSIVALIFLPILNISEIRSSAFRPFFKVGFWVFFCIFIILGWLGGMPIEYPFLHLGQIFTFMYFFMLLPGFMFLSFFEVFLFSLFIKR